VDKEEKEQYNALLRKMITRTCRVKGCGRVFKCLPESNQRGCMLSHSVTIPKTITSKYKVDIEEIRRLWQTGMTAVDVARRVGIPVHVLHYYTRYNGIDWKRQPGDRYAE
jgi:hypothetical protein